MKEQRDMETNAQDHGGREIDPQLKTTDDEPSRASNCSPRLYTKDEVIQRIQIWAEMHNPEFSWNWNRIYECEKELQSAFAVGVTVQLPMLVNMFN